MKNIKDGVIIAGCMDGVIIAGFMLMFDDCCVDGVLVAG